MTGGGCTRGRRRRHPRPRPRDAPRPAAGRSCTQPAQKKAHTTDVTILSGHDRPLQERSCQISHVINQKQVCNKPQFSAHLGVNSDHGLPQARTRARCLRPLQRRLDLREHDSRRWSLCLWRQTDAALQETGCETTPAKHLGTRNAAHPSPPLVDLPLVWLPAPVRVRRARLLQARGRQQRPREVVARVPVHHRRRQRPRPAVVCGSGDTHLRGHRLGRHFLGRRHGRQVGGDKTLGE